jgi:hypothetical protein
MRWDYLDELSRLGNSFNPITPAQRKLYDTILSTRCYDLCGYKDKCYKLVDNNTFAQL